MAALPTITLEPTPVVPCVYCSDAAAAIMRVSIGVESVCMEPICCLCAHNAYGFDTAYETLEAISRGELRKLTHADAIEYAEGAHP